MATCIQTEDYPIYIGEDALQILQNELKQEGREHIYILADDNTARHCLPVWDAYWPGFPVHTLPAGEQHKNLEACASIWQFLTDRNADRRTLLMNFGGGMVGDLGGFAAACYKRGIDFLQVPTSLLAMVDASVGGKTGLNFSGFKNQVGAFKNPIGVFVAPEFLKTLPQRELKSGFAEMVKHCLVADQGAWEALSDLNRMPTHWEAHIFRSIGIKADIVAQDPFENGPRKALNFGHTVGHALESHFLHHHPEMALLHGEAVAMGMICESFLGYRSGLLSESSLNEITEYLHTVFGMHEIPEMEQDAIALLALQDKKNLFGEIRCTLLDGIGKARIDVPVTRAEIVESIAYYRHL